MSSHDVVAAVKRALGGRVRVGHAGTLDPFATGLLIVLVGRATKSQQRLMELPKRYETVARLGCVSSTGDPEGEITYTGRLPPDPPALPTGQITQRPPRHSAVKIAGVRAYKRARRGETFQTPERIVTVYRFEQLWRVRDASPRAHPGERPRQADSRSQSSEHMQALPEHGEARSERSETLSERAAYAIECSSGTYVRSLIADLHDAYCLELRRTAIGPFAVGEAIAPPRPGTRWEGTDALITLQDALARLPT